MENKIQLDKETDYTVSELRDFLNLTVKRKITGKQFTLQDVQQYELRGAIPFQYGSHKIVTIESKEIGIKILRVEGLREEKVKLMNKGHYRDIYVEQLNKKVKEDQNERLD